MAWMSCIANCCACGALFSFNPDRVPSIRGFYKAGRFVPDQSGEREPVCRPCAEKFNKIRKDAKMPEMPILPGAYEAEEIA